MPRNAGLIIMALVGVSALAWFFAQRGPVGSPSHASCFSHEECAKGEWCVVLPKDDGFATMGVCGEPCEGDEPCPNGWRCTLFLESTEQILVPVGTRGVTGGRRTVCAPRKVSGG